MTDVVEIAKECQARLATEIAKLDDFIRMAGALVENSLSKSSKASDTEDEKAAGGNGAEAERGLVRPQTEAGAEIVHHPQ